MHLISPCLFCLPAFPGWLLWCEVENNDSVTCVLQITINRGWILKWKFHFPFLSQMKMASNHLLGLVPALSLVHPQGCDCLWSPPASRDVTCPDLNGFIASCAPFLGH